MVGIALIGPGAIGCAVAAALVPAHPDLVLCARTPFDRLRVDSPSGTVDTPVRVITDPAGASSVDWVLIATKTYDAPATALWLAPLVGPRTRVAVLQNGVEHVERFSPWVPADRIVPVVVELPVERVSPGVVVVRREGWLKVPSGQNGSDFAALFRDGSIPVSTTADWLDVAWEKLALNCAGAVNALTGRLAGIVSDAGVAALMHGLASECLSVGRVEGAVLPDDLADRVLARSRASPPDAVNSLLADRLAGRRMEWDARNAVIPRRAARHGLSAPLNTMAATLLAAIE